jgi:hypothetical protein
MPKDFYTRLRTYYLKVAEVLRGEADAASVFTNTSDVGISRERVYAAFLRQHAPSKCNVFLGGFLFHEDGTESKQLDVIVTTDTTPRFDFHNQDGGGKSFSPVEGTLAIAAIKSTLDKKELFEALDGIASIPATSSLEGRLSPIAELTGYEDWPYKILYASNGIEGPTIFDHINNYYLEHPEIPLYRRPHIVHVAGKYVIFRAVKGMKLHDRSRDIIEDVGIGKFQLFTSVPDLLAIVWALHNIQQNAASSTEILFNYSDIINRVMLQEH